jgi:hypothetical protein
MGATNTALGLTFVVAVAACAGGTTEGPLSGPGPGPNEPPEGHEDSDDNPFLIGTPPIGTGGFGGEGGFGNTGGVGGCIHCADVLSGNFDPNGEACPESANTITEFVSCACVTCESECQSFCSELVLDSTCTSCLSVACTSTFQTCQAN